MVRLGAAFSGAYHKGCLLHLSSSSRPPLSRELNILAKAREDREDSEESGLEDAEADAPQGWQAQANPCSSDRGMVKVSALRGLGSRRSLLSFLEIVDKSITPLPRDC